MDHVSQMKAEALRASASRRYHDASLRSIVIETCGDLADRLDNRDPLPEAALAVAAGISAWMLGAVKNRFEEVNAGFSSDEIDAAYRALVDTASAKIDRALGNG